MKRLNKQTLQAISYAQNALSFLFLEKSIENNIQAIYLYGSAVRGELEKESDIDLFIDCTIGKEKMIEGAAKAACSRFFISKDYEKWKHFDFCYPLSLHTGQVMTWQLKTSIMTEGILLYSKKTALPLEERYALVTFVLPKNKKKYLQLIRSLYGRKEKGYKEHGLLVELQGKKISTTVLLVPLENVQKLLQFFIKKKVEYEFKEICLL